MSPRQPISVVFPSFTDISGQDQDQDRSSSGGLGVPPTSRSSLPTPPTSPRGVGTRQSTQSERRVEFTPAPPRIHAPRKRSEKKEKDEKEDDGLADVERELAGLPVVLKQPKQSVGTLSSMESSKSAMMYQDCDSCMEGESYFKSTRVRTMARTSKDLWCRLWKAGAFQRFPENEGHHTVTDSSPAGLGHETKSASYKLGTEKAYHHLQRANDYFIQALSFKPLYPKGMLARSKVLIQLAMNYQPPKVAIVSLKEAVKLLRQLCALAPQSVSARETLAQACAMLSSILHDTDDTADEEGRVWSGPTGKLAREALQNLEEVAADKMDRMRGMDSKTAAEIAPSMAEMFLALASAAITVSSLAVDLPTVDLHVEVAEQALDQASNMATMAAAAKVKSSTSSANLITRVQLASGRSSLERLRHTFVLGCDLDEDDFKSLMADMALLATECRERAVKLKGSKAAAASTLGWEATKQLGDAKILYASLLRLVWRKRRPKRRGLGSGDSHSPHTGARKVSQRAGSAEMTIQEEPEPEEEGKGEGEEGRRESNVSAARSSVSAGASRKGSALESVSEGTEVSRFNHHSRPSASSISISPRALATGRRGSWLPMNPDGTFGRSRRLSSMSAPLIGTDGTTSAWNRKASIISLTTDEEAEGLTPSSELAQASWNQLEGATKQFKLALSLLGNSDLPSMHLARAKADTLSQIAYASLFQASLAPRVLSAAEKRTSCLVTAEVYATWAAREVGWSFLIEGTKESAAADKRTNSWRADESGKRAVMLLVRIWWHRAVTTEAIDIETKAAAKDAVEVVVRRMRDREGVRDGDVVRWKNWLGKYEGEMDAAETLFWRSVSRILRGGAGFVMS